MSIYALNWTVFSSWNLDNIFNAIGIKLKQPITIAAAIVIGLILNGVERA